MVETIRLFDSSTRRNDPTYWSGLFQRLESMLLEPRFADKPVCVVSIAGEFRKGKSFMLNLFLRYLRARASNGGTRQGAGGWLEHGGSIINAADGFHFRGGCERDTVGIHLWPEAFVLRTEHGRELVVLLIDTQGLWDMRTRDADNTFIFCLSTMLSSMQIVNIHQRFCDKDMKAFEYFTLYAEMASKSAPDAARDRVAAQEGVFQSLLFLVRDWRGELQFGYKGGTDYLNEELDTRMRPEAPDDLRRVAVRMQSTFADLRCFLMPYPGNKVATGKFGGNLRDVEPRFRKCVDEFVPGVFEGGRLSAKQIAGQPITCRQWIFYAKQYVSAFRAGNVPRPQSLLKASAEAAHQAASQASRNHYDSKMAQCTGETPLSHAALLEVHEKCETESLSMYERAKKITLSDEAAAEYLQELKSDMQELFNVFECRNKQKIEYMARVKEADDAVKAKNEAQKKLEATQARLREIQRQIEEEARLEREREEKRRQERVRLAAQLAEQRRQAEVEEARLESERRVNARMKAERLAEQKRKDEAEAAQLECQIKEANARRERWHAQQRAEQERQNEELNRKRNAIHNRRNNSGWCTLL